MNSQADLSSIISNAGNFEAFISQLQVADNDIRSQAEAVYNQLKESQLEACISNLIQVMRRSQNIASRQFCAILLRKILTKDMDVWGKCTPNMQAVIKNELLLAVREEHEKAVLRKVCDTVSDLACLLSGNDGWQDIVPFVFQCVQSGEPRLIEASLSIFSTLAHYMTDDLRPQLPVIHSMLVACLSHNDKDVQLASMRGISNFIQALEENSEREVFQPQLPQMLSFLGNLLNAGDETSAQEVLEMFIEIAEAYPRMLRKNLPEIVSAALSVSRAEGLDEATRRLSAEFLVTLCEAREKAPGMMRKLPQFTAQLFETLMMFLLDIEDDARWHLADNDEYEEEGCGERYEFGQECLDRLSISLGGNAVVPVAGVLLPHWMADADWRKRNAVLICLAQIAEGCAKVMTKQLSALVGFCISGLQDSHPRVRWAACQAVGQMCTDLGPTIQEEHHARILPALMAAMDDFNSPRVQAHASAAVVNFSENCEASLLPPYLDTLIMKLMLMLQNGKKLVQEGALTAMASVADCAQTLFVKYYDSVMPLLSSILLGAGDDQHRLLRAKALECISLVGMAVGVERFRNDASHVMAFMAQLQAAGLKDDDPTAGYVLQAGARLCKCLRSEFLPYLSTVMPPLLKSAKLEPEMKVHDAEEIDEDEDDGEFEHIPCGDKTLTIRTAGLEDKATACNMLCCYAEELKEGFFPYVKTVADIMVPLLKFWYHEEVRRAAVASLPDLLRSSTLAMEKGVAGADAAFVRGLFEYMWGPLMDALAKEPDTEVASGMLDAVTEIVDLVDTSLMKPEYIELAFNNFKHVMEEAEGRRLDREKRRTAEDFDEEEKEALEEENEAEEELFDQVGTAVGAFLKHYSDAVLPAVESLMAQFVPLLNKERPPEDRRIAVCIIDDLLEHSPAGRQKYGTQLLPMLLEGVSDSYPDLRQCCAYGLSILARLAPAIFRPAAPQAVQKLLAIVQAPDAKSEDNEVATDNVISALARILEFHSEAVDANAVAAAWVAALPVKGDALEGLVNHELLVRLLEAHDARVIGHMGAHLPAIARVMVTVLGHGKRLVAPDVGRRMASLLHVAQASVPADVLSSAVAALTPKQQSNFQTYMSGQVPVDD